MLSIAKLQEANAKRNRHWDPEDKLSLTFKSTELAGETGEACNKIKKLERERLGIRGSRTTIEDTAEEIADVVICAVLLANAVGFDLERAVARKFNLTSVANQLPVFFPTCEECGKVEDKIMETDKMTVHICGECVIKSYKQARHNLRGETHEG